MGSKMRMNKSGIFRAHILAHVRIADVVLSHELNEPKYTLENGVLTGIATIDDVTDRRAQLQ